MSVWQRISMQGDALHFGACQYIFGKHWTPSAVLCSARSKTLLSTEGSCAIHGGKGVISVVWFHCSGNKPPPSYREKAVFWKKPTPGSHFHVSLSWSTRFHNLHFHGFPTAGSIPFSPGWRPAGWQEDEICSARMLAPPATPVKETAWLSFTIHPRHRALDTWHSTWIIASTFLSGVTMKSKKACPGTAAVILWKCQNAKDPSNKHRVIYIHSEKSIKTTEREQLCTTDFQINAWVWEWLQAQNEKIWMKS